MQKMETDLISTYLMSVLDSLGIEIVILDENSKILFANRSWKEFALESGKKREKTSENANYLQICDSASGKHSQGASSAAAGIRKVLSGHIDIFTHEYPCPDADGIIQWYEMNVSKLKSQTPTQLVVTHTLITKRKEYEFAIQKSNIDLEKTVTDRTLELSEAVRNLEIEVSRHQQTEAELRDSQDRIRDFSRNLNKSIERERKEIAREIHDELGQTLTALKLDIAWLQRHSNPKSQNTEERFSSSIKLIQSTIATVKDILTRLRPSLLQEMGLSEAIEWQINNVARRTGIESKFFSNIKKIKFTEEANLIIYRLFQEAINNVVKHSGSRTVEVSLLASEGKVILSIVDAGVGIKPENIAQKSTFGIRGIRERVAMLDGDFSIKSLDTGGTKMIITFTLENIRLSS